MATKKFKSGQGAEYWLSASGGVAVIVSILATAAYLFAFIGEGLSSTVGSIWLITSMLCLVGGLFVGSVFHGFAEHIRLMKYQASLEFSGSIKTTLPRCYKCNKKLEPGNNRCPHCLVLQKSMEEQYQDTQA